MMKNIIYAFIAISLSLVSCTERIELKTDEMDDRVVIYGELNADKSFQTITVSKTAPYFSKIDNVPIEDATVTIVSEDNERWVLKHDSAGVYKTVEELKPNEGEKYTLRVECDYDNDGVKDIFTANTTIPVAIPLDSVEYVPDKMVYDVYNATIYTDIPKNGRYCMYKFYENDTIMTPKISDFLIADIKFWNKNGYLNGLMCAVFFDKKDMDEFDDDELDDYNFVSPGDNVTIEMSMIDEGYYDFIDQCQTELNGENPMFGGPAANIITNISNGGYGYFGSTNYVRRSNIIPKHY